MAEAARLRSGDERDVRRETTSRAPPVSAVLSPATVSRSPFDTRRGILLSQRRVQPSLKVSSPNDPAEREAERVAAAVMAIPDAAPRIPAGGARTAQRTPLIAARQPLGARAPPASMSPPAQAASAGGADAATEA
jgi:hypothetical protein